VGGKVKVSAALSTVVVELVLDMLMVVSLLAVTLPFVEQAGILQSIGIGAGAAAVIAIAVLIVIAVRPNWVRLVARWLLARVPRLDPDRWLSILDGLLDGLSALRSLRRLMALLAWSVLAWTFVVGFYWAMLWVFLDQPPLVQGSLLTCAVGLGMALPSAPGAVGVFHTAATYGLTLPFEIPKEEALAIAFVTHAVQYAFSCLLGAMGLTRLGLSLRRLQADATAVAGAVASERDAQEVLSTR
jgi:uncharacterized membrane protein YbhN (UPF0104 family)